MVMETFLLFLPPLSNCEMKEEEERTLKLEASTHSNGKRTKNTLKCLCVRGINNVHIHLRLHKSNAVATFESEKNSSNEKSRQFKFNLKTEKRKFVWRTHSSVWENADSCLSEFEFFIFVFLFVFLKRLKLPLLSTAEKKSKNGVSQQNQKLNSKKTAEKISWIGSLK